MNGYRNLGSTMKYLRIIILITAILGNTGCMESPAYGKSVEDIFSSKEAQDLARASCEGDSGELSRLISMGVDVNAVGLHNVTPLIWALTCNGLEFPDIQAAQWQKSQSRTIKAVDPDFLAGLKVLLAAGADSNQMIDGDFGPIYPGGEGYYIDHYTPVLIAAEFHQASVLKLLLQNGGNPNAADGDNEHTALGVAFNRGYFLDLSPQMAPFDSRQWENFYLLLDAGADPSIMTINGGNVVVTAAMNRVDVAHNILKKYKYSGDLEEIARILINRIEVGFPDHDRRKLLEFLKIKKNVNIDAIWRELR
ncbi:MAG: hypothetical protein HEQ34_05670 [Sphingorhabdus sp.]|jgi:hypothetical protein|uniref:ankyrin repeat domain-containing protein n=1 Tax=Sphingorhabdus sp. TaxID=1902408 RepID=UPI0025D834E2|nr:hypothetical protein [Sphingorhabdus sp.]MCO4091431.1 hypothetical protein [Sphingorhabdus sp.]